MAAKEPKYTFTVPVTWVPKQKFIDKLFNVEQKHEAERTFEIYSQVVVSTVRIAKRIELLPNELKDGSLLEVVMPLYNEHISDIIYVIAAAIQNNHLEPNAKLITFLERNLSADEIMAAWYASIEALELQAFLNCIVLAKGTSRILKPRVSKEEQTV